MQLLGLFGRLHRLNLPISKQSHGTGSTCDGCQPVLKTLTFNLGGTICDLFSTMTLIISRKYCLMDQVKVAREYISLLASQSSWAKGLRLVGFKVMGRMQIPHTIHRAMSLTSQSWRRLQRLQTKLARQECTMTPKSKRRVPHSCKISKMKLQRYKLLYQGFRMALLLNDHFSMGSRFCHLIAIIHTAHTCSKIGYHIGGKGNSIRHTLRSANQKTIRT